MEVLALNLLVVVLITLTLEKGLELEIVGEIVSKPYILMTLNLMRNLE